MKDKRWLDMGGEEIHAEMEIAYGAILNEVLAGEARYQGMCYLKESVGKEALKIAKIQRLLVGWVRNMASNHYEHLTKLEVMAIERVVNIERMFKDAHLKEEDNAKSEHRNPHQVKQV